MRPVDGATYRSFHLTRDGAMRAKARAQRRLLLGAAPWIISARRKRLGLWVVTVRVLPTRHT